MNSYKTSHTSYSSHTTHSSHSVCFHCFYNISSIEFLSKFQQVFIFDENYNMEIYRFCSLNCGLKFIMDSKTQLVKKLKNFFDYYEVSPKEVIMPLNINMEDFKNLDYKNYRKNFICLESNLPDTFSDLETNLLENNVRLEANLPDTFWSPENFSNYSDILGIEDSKDFVSGIEDSLELCSKDILVNKSCK